MDRKALRRKKNDIRRIVDAAGHINPELRKETIYSWEKGFIEDKEEEEWPSPKKTILRKDELRKSGQALTKPLKGKIASKTGSTMKASRGSTTKNQILQMQKLICNKNRR